MRFQPGVIPFMPASGLSIVRRTYTPESLHHCHPFRQIVLPEHGRLEMSVEGRTGAVGGARLAIVESGQEHVCWAPTPTRCLVVDLPNPVVADSRSGQTDSPFRDLDARLTTISHAIKVELAIGGAADPLIAEGLGAYLTAALTTQTISTPIGPRLTASQRRIAVAARDYVESRVCDGLTIAEIADAVGASAAHVQRCFRAQYGLSVIGYVHQARLRRAATLLQTTDQTMTEIALAVGFADARYFARLFRRQYGVAPARFRFQN
jgi:AraC-like DNA-binding protein